MNTSSSRLTHPVQVEQEVLARLEQLAPGFKVLRSKKEIRRGDSRPDLVVAIRYGEKRKTLLIETKSSSEPAFLHKAISQLRLASGRWPNSYSNNPLADHKGVEVKTLG